MKRIFLLTAALLLISVSCFAKVTEWIDPSFNFNNVKRVYVVLNVPDYFRNGERELEMQQAFYPKIKDNLKAKLPSGYKVDSIFRVVERIKAEEFVDLEELYKKSPEEATNIFYKYVGNNYDLGVYVTMIAYDTGYEYVEGITWNQPTTYQSTVTDVFNPSRQWNVTTTGPSQPTKIGNGVYPAVYVTARLDVFNMNGGRSVWSRVDSRGRLIKPLNQTTNDAMFTRMSGDFAQSIYRKLTTAEGKPTGKSINANPAGF
jgi:hypothetical protein